MDLRGLACFVGISLLLMLCLFFPAAKGTALLAPLDIPANFFSKWRFVDPSATGVPANHYVIDLITSDVPRNWLVYQAWSNGEMPWWDPYVECGRPLGAEAHVVNVSDPVKVVLYHLLPFELAYNWTRLLPFVIAGATAFVLFRGLGFGFAPSFWGALLYQFAGCNTMMFSGPSMQAAFAWFPLIWLFWDRGATTGRFLWFALSAVPVGLVFLCGNLQTHAFLALFTGAWWLGYSLGELRRAIKHAGGIAVSLMLGMGLSAPMLISQVELFLLSSRQVETVQPPLAMLSGLLSLSTVFPWMLGTFRTLDIGKIIAQNSLGFWIYIGSAAVFMAALAGFWIKPASPAERWRKRTALVLIGLYLVICSSPLIKVFYTRSGWLAVLGMVYLFVLAWEHISSRFEWPKNIGRWVLAVTAVIALAVNLAAGVVYPRYQARIEEYVLRKQATNKDLDEASALRKFQVANFPREVTVRNPETVLALASMVGLGLLLLRRPERPTPWLHVILCLNTLPLILFLGRYAPQQPVELWHRLQEGGPEQQRLIAATENGALRLRTVAPGVHEWPFPGTLCELFHLHNAQGYSSLSLHNAGTIYTADGNPAPAYYDVLYQTPERGQTNGVIAPRETQRPSRYFWATPVERSVTISRETLNTVRYEFGDGPAGDLIRTDTWYPGWKVVEPKGLKLLPEPPCFSRLHVPADVREVTLAYSPRGLGAGIIVAALSLILLLLAGIRLRRQSSS